MELKYDINTPRTSGKIVEIYLQVLKENEEYDVWTINEDLEIIKCKGKIKNNAMYNYHNNYDDSENELYIKFPYRDWQTWWFSLNKEDVIKVQQENIKKWKAKLEKELNRLEKITV